MAPYPSGKGEVCKTFMHRFESDRRLSSLFMRSDSIQHVVRILRKEIQQWPVPALSHYVETPYTVLISCILSLRTQDKTTNAASQRLFAIASTPQAMLATPVPVIQKAIYPVSFYRVKAKTIHAIERHRINRFLNHW